MPPTSNSSLARQAAQEEWYRQKLETMYDAMKKLDACAYTFEVDPSAKGLDLGKKTSTDVDTRLSFAYYSHDDGNATRKLTATMTARDDSIVAPDAVPGLCDLMNDAKAGGTEVPPKTASVISHWTGSGTTTEIDPYLKACRTVAVATQRKREEATIVAETVISKREAAQAEFDVAVLSEDPQKRLSAAKRLNNLTEIAIDAEATLNNNKHFGVDLLKHADEAVTVFRQKLDDEKMLLVCAADLSTEEAAMRDCVTQQLDTLQERLIHHVYNVSDLAGRTYIHVIDAAQGATVPTSEVTKSQWKKSLRKNLQMVEDLAHIENVAHKWDQLRSRISSQDTGAAALITSLRDDNDFSVFGKVYNIRWHENQGFCLLDGKGAPAEISGYGKGVDWAHYITKDGKVDLASGVHLINKQMGYTSDTSAGLGVDWMEPWGDAETAPRASEIIQELQGLPVDKVDGLGHGAGLLRAARALSQRLQATRSRLKSLDTERHLSKDASGAGEAQASQNLESFITLFNEQADSLITMSGDLTHEIDVAVENKIALACQEAEQKLGFLNATERTYVGHATLRLHEWVEGDQRDARLASSILKAQLGRPHKSVKDIEQKSRRKLETSETIRNISAEMLQEELGTGWESKAFEQWLDGRKRIREEKGPEYVEQGLKKSGKSRSKWGHFRPRATQGESDAEPSVNSRRLAASEEESDAIRSYYDELKQCWVSVIPERPGQADDDEGGGEWAMTTFDGEQGSSHHQRKQNRTRRVYHAREFKDVVLGKDTEWSPAAEPMEMPEYRGYRPGGPVKVTYPEKKELSEESWAVIEEARAVFKENLAESDRVRWGIQRESEE